MGLISLDVYTPVHKCWGRWDKMTDDLIVLTFTCSILWFNFLICIREVVTLI